jgi:hypothetical protein
MDESPSRQGRQPSRRGVGGKRPSSGGKAEREKAAREKAGSEERATEPPAPGGARAEAPIDSVRRLLADAERVSLELGRLADEMVTRSEAGRRDARLIIAALAEAAATLEGDDIGKPAPEEPGVDRTTEPPPATSPAGSDGARLLARQMLANGADRDDVERDLRTSFGVENAEAVVDSILAGG